MTHALQHEKNLDDNDNGDDDLCQVRQIGEQVYSFYIANAEYKGLLLWIQGQHDVERDLDHAEKEHQRVEGGHNHRALLPHVLEYVVQRKYQVECKQGDSDAEQSA